MNTQNAAVSSVPAVIPQTVFAADIRKNANGVAMGRRLSFLQGHPAGDIRKALKGEGLKGKELTKAVDKVLRGDSTMGWACFEASVSAARSNGFVPVVGDLNKAGTKLTVKLEKASAGIDKDTALHAAKTQLTKEELLEIVSEMETKAKASPGAKGAVINV